MRQVFVVFPWGRCLYCFHEAGVCGVSMRQVFVVFPWGRCLWCFHEADACVVFMRQVFVLFPWGRCLWCFHEVGVCNVSIRQVFVLFPFGKLMHTAACTLYCGSVCAGDLEEEGVQQLPSGQTVMVPVNCYLFNPFMRERGSLSSPPPCCWNTDLMHLCVQDVCVYVVCLERKGWYGWVGVG